MEAGRATGQENYNPGIAYIVVSKRINTRFFSGSEQRADNPPPGLVVDNTVTLYERFDFFLISQKVTQGTVSPTSYNIVEDSTKTSPDIHQRLAYALTHLYYNWSVSIPINYFLLFFARVFFCLFFFLLCFYILIGFCLS